MPIIFTAVAAKQFVMDKLSDIFLSALLNIWDLGLWLENTSKILKNWQRMTILGKTKLVLRCEDLPKCFFNIRTWHCLDFFHHFTFHFNNKINKVCDYQVFNKWDNLKLDSHLPKKLFSLLQWKPFKNDKKCFLFYLKSSFRSQDI